MPSSLDRSPPRQSHFIESLEARRLLSGQMFAGQGVAVPGNPVNLVTADFNGDGHLDFVSANGGPVMPGTSAVLSQTLSVALGRGDGTFAAPVTLTPGIAPRGLVAADFNNDGNIDLAATSHTPRLAVLLGNGDGTFAPAVVTTVVAAGYSMTAGDFNEDGRTDLAITDTISGSYAALVIVLGNGDGTFAAAKRYNTNVNYPSCVIAADLNADGNLDLATANNQTNGSVSVLLGTGLGTFGTAKTVPIGVQPLGVVAADVNGDGRLDLATSNSLSSSISVAFGNGDGTFATAKNYPSTYAGQAIAAADFDGDGRVDLATSNTNTTFAVDVLRNNGDGTFAKSQTLRGASNGRAIVTADFNEDGRADLLVAAVSNVNRGFGIDGGVVNALLGRVDGSFAAAAAIDTGVSFYRTGLITADFNGDRKADLLATSSGGRTVGVSLGNGDGTFAAASVFTPTSPLGSPVACDFNHDGIVDLAGEADGAKAVTVLIGKGDGTFAPAIALPLWLEAVNVAVGDFNGDGNADIFANLGPFYTSMLLGRGDGTFAAAIRWWHTDYPGGLVTSGDFNGDGKLDILASHSSLSGNSYAFCVLPGRGDGTFSTPRVSSKTASRGAYGLATADFDRDGNADVATIAVDWNNALGVMTFRGRGDGTFVINPVFDGETIHPTAAQPEAILTADFNGDGLADIATASQAGGTVSVLLGDGHGAFAAPATLGVGSAPTAFVAGDFNGDGRTDMATADYFSKSGAVVLNTLPGLSGAVLSDAVMTISGVTGSLTLGTAAGGLSVTTDSGTQVFPAGSVRGIVLENVRATVTSDLAAIGMVDFSVSAGATVTFAVTQHLAALSVDGSAVLASGGSRLLRVSDLVLGTAGTLDLTDNALICDYTTAAGQAGSVRSLISAARTGGTWAGAGLTSSAARANAASSTLGYLEASDYKSIHGTAAAFVGEAVDQTAVLVRYTLHGDTDLDLGVSINDFNRLSTAFGAGTGKTWIDGDLDYDGGTSINDFSLLSASFGKTMPVPATPPVPRKGIAPAKR